MTQWTPVKEKLPAFGELVHVARSNGARFVGKLSEDLVWSYITGNHAYYMRPSDKWRPVSSHED